MDPIGKKLLDVAKDELGYTEKSDGYTKFGEWYRKNLDDDHNPYFSTAPWCDMFLAWAADKAGVTDQAGQFAATVKHATWFKDNDAWGTKPEPGAIVFFAWDGSGEIGAIDHVGIVEKVSGDEIHTIEANVDRVYLKRKVRDESSIVGYGYPAKVKVAEASEPSEKYVPKHAAPAPTPSELAAEQAGKGEEAVGKTDKPTVAGQELPVGQDAVLGGLIAVVVAGTVALAAGKSAAAKVPTTPPVRVRKRGKHHRKPVPVSLPADVTPAHLDEAENSTVMMPAVSAAVAAEAEDREFWGRIKHFKDDEELAFWDTLHSELTSVRPEPRVERVWESDAPEDAEQQASGHAVPSFGSRS